MKPPRLFQQVLILLAVSILVAGCSGAAGEQGKITGLKAQIPMEEVQSGNLAHLKFIPAVNIQLSDGELSSAVCSGEMLTEITKTAVLPSGGITYTIDQIVFSPSTGGFVATINIQLEEPLDITLDKNDEDQWEVIEITG
jgi:hypothetical protein